MTETTPRPTQYPCTCRFSQKDEFSAGELLQDTICGYHATRERDLAELIKALEPFAKAADNIDAASDPLEQRPWFNQGPILKARALLARLRETR